MYRYDAYTKPTLLQIFQRVEHLSTYEYCTICANKLPFININVLIEVLGLQ